MILSGILWVRDVWMNIILWGLFWGWITPIAIID